MATIVDDFERADGAIGSDYTTEPFANSWQISSGRATGGESYGTSVIHDTPTDTADQYLETVPDAASNGCDHTLLLRVASDVSGADGYRLVGQEVYYNGAFVAGYWGAIPADPTLRVEVNGDGDYEFSVDGVVRHTGTPVRSGGTGSNHVGMRGTSSAFWHSLSFGDMGGDEPEPQTWTGTAATIEATATPGAFAGAGTAAWAGSTAPTVEAVATSGAFTPGPVVWAGSTPPVVEATASSGAFTPSGAAVWPGGSATVEATPTSGSFTPGPATWPGSPSPTVDAVPASGAFAGTGTAAWAGSTVALEVLASSGAFGGGSIWTGSTPPTVEVVAASGSFAAGGVADWTGGATSVAVAAASGAFIPSGAAVWTGHPVALEVVAASGVWADNSRTAPAGASILAAAPAGASAATGPGGTSTMTATPEGSSAWQT